MNIAAEIHPPSRTTPFGRVLILFTVVLYSLHPFLRPALPVLAALATMVTLCAWFVKSSSQPLHISLFTFFFLSWRILAPHLAGIVPTRWPFALLVPLLLYLAVVVPVPRLRQSLDWFKAGSIDRVTAVIIAGMAVVAAVALYLWVLLAAPELSHHLRNVPAMPAMLLPFAGIGFSLVNAFLEECVFRGIMMQALDASFGPRSASVLVQAWLFGALHFLRGFPNGYAGLLLAAIYGLMLGWLRRNTRGMFAPFLTHVCADLIIFAILASRLSIA